MGARGIFIPAVHRLFNTFVLRMHGFQLWLHCIPLHCALPKSLGLGSMASLGMSIQGKGHSGALLGKEQLVGINKYNKYRTTLMLLDTTDYSGTNNPRAEP